MINWDVSESQRPVRYRRDLQGIWRVALACRLARWRERLALKVKGSPAPDAAVLVAGSGRSGTSWLARLIVGAPGMQVIFEPLHPNRVPAPGGLGSHAGRRAVLESPYLRPDQVDAHWERFFQQVLTGQVRNWWTDQERQHWFAWRYVIKMIRANLMLGWLAERFQPSIVVVLRHPCAVVRSRLARGWEASLERLLNQPALLEDHLGPFVPQIRAAQSDLDRHAILWAVETLVMLRQMGGRPGALLFYEELCRAPLAQMGALYGWLGWPFGSGVMQTIRQQCGGADERCDQLDRWAGALSIAQRDRILEIVRGFGLTMYDETPYPQIEALDSTGGGVYHSFVVISGEER